jgi:hypothetical protein
MATNKTKPSKTKQDRYAKYKLANKFNANFIKRLERHLKKYPNDTCAKEALIYRLRLPVLEALLLLDILFEDYRKISF